MSFWIITLLAIVFILLTMSLALYFMQDSMIFNAEKLPSDFKFSFRNEFEEFNLKTEDNETLNGILFKAKEPKGAVLFYHNSSGNINTWSTSGIFLNNLDYDVLIMDYRGFGKSTGKLDEQLMLKDSLIWYDLMKDLYKENSFIVYGRGLGALLATYASSKNNPNKLLLESPLYSANFTSKYHYPYLPVRLLLKYKFETYRYIENVKCKIYFFHGMKNKLVSYTSSEKLYELVKDNSELCLMPDCTHYDLIESPVYLKKIRKILLENRY